MTHAGRTRTYILAMPVSYDPTRAYPLVLAFHGNPGTAVGLRDDAPFDTASRDEAIIAYPQSAQDSNWDLYTPLVENRDMYFVQALVAEIATKANVDRSRVYGFGFSGGAFFVAQVACRIGGVFKAVAAHSGGGPDEPLIGDAARQPNGCILCAGGATASIVIHGASDTEVVPESGAYTAKCFASTNTCSAGLVASTPQPCLRFSGCPADKPVDTCTIPGLGHAVWAEGLAASWRFFRSIT